MQECRLKNVEKFLKQQEKKEMSGNARNRKLFIMNSVRMYIGKYRKICKTNGKQRNATKWSKIYICFL